MKFICKVFGHNLVVYKWVNKLDITNTHGNYIKNNGGEVTDYLCTRCPAFKQVN